MTSGLLLLLGLGALVVGGESFVSGALRLGALLRVSAWTTGATLVAFATSAPELAVNLSAASDGHIELAFGNVVGSNLANIGLVLGIAALLRPFALSDHGRERRALSITLVGVLVLAVEGLLRGASAEIGRLEGGALVVGFLYFASGLRGGEAPQAGGSAPVRWGPAVGMAAAGMAFLIIGAELAVEGAVRSAAALDLSPALVGLSAVAVGTSLPEFFAALAAARRGEADLLLGTILGSNLFNLLLVLGATALVSPVPIPPGGGADLAALAVFSALLVCGGALRWPLNRGRGAALVVAYLGYLSARFVAVG